MVFCCVKDFLARRRSVKPAQAWTNSICRSMRWGVLPRLLKAEIGTFRTSRDVRLESEMRAKADARRPLQIYSHPSLVSIPTKPASTRVLPIICMPLMLTRRIGRRLRRNCPRRQTYASNPYNALALSTSIRRRCCSSGTQLCSRLSSGVVAGIVVIWPTWGQSLPQTMRSG
jgi:hypothetical protein